MSELEAEKVTGVGRNKFLMLVAIAFTPIAISYLTYFFMPGWIPTSTTNEGAFMSPPLELGERLDLSGKWELLMAPASNCNAECKQALVNARQVHISLNKNTPRLVRRIILAEPAPESLSGYLGAEHAGVEVIVNPTLYKDLVSRSAVAGMTALYLMDPNGNVILFYVGDKTGKPMLKDMKHLMKLSNIG